MNVRVYNFMLFLRCVLHLLEDLSLRSRTCRSLQNVLVMLAIVARLVRMELYARLVFNREP